MPDTTGANGLREDFRVVGKANLPGLTSYAMATGVAKYGTDFTVPGMLFAKFLRCPYPHAKVRSIDESEALAIPGVLDVVKWDDPIFSELGANPMGGGGGGSYLPQEAHYESQEAGCIVIAESEALCDEALKALKVEWEVLPFITDIFKGAEPDHPLIRGPELIEKEAADYRPGGMATAEGHVLMTKHYPTDPPREANVTWNIKVEGDLDEGFRKADFILEYDVNIPTCISTIPNPPASVAYWGDSMYKGPGQKIYIEGAPHRRESIMSMYHKSSDEVVQEGLFQGGKYCDWGLRKSQEITPLLSKRMGGRPVRCCNTREETFDLNRNERHMHLRLGVTRDGVITAVEDNTLVDNGAPGSSTMGSVSDRDWGGYYTLRCKDITQRFKVVDSNIGFMHTCAQFVPYNWDSITVGFDLIAEKLGLDPVEVARRNLHGPASQDDPNPVPSFEASLELGKKLMDWQWHPAGTKRLPDGRLHGASFRYAICPRHSFMDYFCKLEYRDGVVHFPTQGPIAGWFSTECFAMIAAEELGLNYEDICVDYDYREKHSDQAGGSDGVTGHGWIVKECANKLKRKILESAARQANPEPGAYRGVFGFPAPPSPLAGASADELDIVDGKVIVKADPSRFVPFSRATRENVTAEFGGYSPKSAWVTGFGRILDTMNTSWCEVAVDDETGEVDILKYCVVPDVGKVIRRTSLESQIDQVVFFSQGCQLLQDVVHDPETGVRLNSNFLDYRVPTTMDVPEVTKEILELRSGNGAYGASGISHNLANSHLIITAIHNATGVWVDPPATPDRVLKALGKCEIGGLE
jgi:CO/xanthine dehydrogenase Mo-binding subunit